MDGLAVVASREAAYGSAVENHRRIARLWSAYTGYDIAPHQVAMMMNLLKISRLAATPDHEDSILDIDGYMKIYRDIVAMEKV